jgi:SAM-dependent methyltransferase
MRSAAEQMLRNYPAFRSIDGTAEETHLESASVDFVTAAQAFHWFDPARSRAELKRILKPGGWVVLMWNDRRHDRPPFSVEYHRVIRAYNSDLDRINHQNVSRDDSDALRRFFGGEVGSAYRSRTFDNFQDLDWDGVQGRLFSSSYMPTPDDPRAASMLAELRRAFEAHQQSGKVRIEYDTRVFWGRLN